jgi:hypothetical protein
MRIEKRQLSRQELASVTSRRPVVRRIPPKHKAHSTGPKASEGAEPEQSTPSYNTSETAGPTGESPNRLDRGNQAERGER